VTPHDHVQQHHHATSSAAPSTADLDAARLLLDRLGISPADLMASTGHQQRAPAPTFAEYIPTVAAAVPPGTRRVYGTYWNRILDHWAHAASTNPPRRRSSNSPNN
jgi:integrase/recombinase XerC